MWLKPDAIMATPRIKDIRSSAIEDGEERPKASSGVSSFKPDSTDPSQLWRPQHVQKLKRRIRSKSKEKKNLNNNPQNRRALELLKQLTTREHFLKLTKPDHLPAMLSYLTENLDRLERYVVVKNSFIEVDQVDDFTPETPGSVKQRTLDAFLGRSVDADPQAPVQPIATKVVMSRVAAR